MKKTNYILVLLLCLLLIVTALGGCKSGDNSTGQASPNNESPANNQKPELATVEILLYFGDDQALYLLPEKRNIKIDEDFTDEMLASSIINELIAGPDNKDLRPTIPEESKLLSLKIEDGIALADFSEEIKSNHWGGSAGETMTLSSIANTLTELDSIDKVQLLIEGKAVETLAGHWDTSQPLERNETIIKK
jgi:germination protein M